MKTKSLAYIIFFISIFALVELKTEPIEIDTLLSGDVYQEKLEGLEAGTDAYFFYSKWSSDLKNLVFTVHTSTANKKFSISCIFSTSTELEDVETDFKAKNSICQVYVDSTTKVYNVIVPLSSAQSGSKVYLDVHAGNTCNVDVVLRGGGSHLSKIENNMKLSDSFAYYACEFEPKDYYQKNYLLSSSLAEGFLVFGENNNENTLIDESSIILLNEQSLAAHFWDYKKIVVFMGKKSVDSSSSDITINYVENSNNLSYYIPRFDFGFSSFHSECSDSSTIHYLISNFGTLNSDKTYNYKFHNEIPEKVLVADLPANTNDVTGLAYKTAKRFNNLEKTDSHLHVFKVQCPGKDKKIILNWKYAETSAKTGTAMYGVVTKDFNLDFSKKDTYTLTYELSGSKELSLEVFTPDTDTETKFKVKFETKTYEINNKNTFLFKVTDTSAKSLDISCSSTINAIVSFSLSIKREDSEDEYYTLYSIMDNDIYYNFYELEHKYNSNYLLYMTVKNPTENIVPLCYYIPTLGVIQNSGNHCFLMKANTEYNITINNLYEKSDDETNFNVEEPKYHLIVYNNRQNQEYEVTKVDFKTNLDKSVPIKDMYNGHTFLYKDDNVEKDKKYYYNINFSSKLKENHFDFYIKTDSDISKVKELQFDMKCIIKYELAAEIVDPYFTEDNNVCYLINNQDYTSNVYHYIFNNTKMASNEYLIIKLVPKIDMKIKFIIDEMNLIESTYSLDEGINAYDEQSVYKIFQIEMSSLGKYSKDMIFYNYDNGTEIYGRKGKKEFIPIKRGAFFLFKPKEISVEFKDYDKILFVYGKSDCENYICDEVSRYQIKYVEHYVYKEIAEFPGSYRFPSSVTKCKTDDTYYIFFDYGKKYEKKDIYLAKNVMYGNLNKNHYIDSFVPGDFEKNYLLYEYFHKINENDLHLSIIKYTCNSNLFVIFDYFTQPNEDTEIQLEKGVMRYYIIRNNTNYTLNYKSINHIQIDVINGNNEPKIYFESRDLKMNTGHHLLLIRQIDNVNKFYIAGLETVDIPVRITTLVGLEDLSKTDINSLYKSDDFYIYVVEKNVASVTFTLRTSSRLRLLLQEGNLNVCYNVGKMILLEKNEANCASLTSSKLVYENQLYGTESYIVLFPAEGSPSFSVIKVETSMKGNDGGENDEEDGGSKKKGGLHWAVILVIIILVIAIVILAVLIFIKMRKKTVTSEDIEGDIKEPTQISQEQE